MLKRLLQIVFTLILVIIISCNWNPLDPDNNNDDPVDTTETWPDPIIPEFHENLNMFPLANGNQWTYRRLSYNYENNLDTAYFTYEINDTKVMNENIYYLLNYPLPLFSPLFSEDNINYDSLWLANNQYGDLIILINNTIYPYLIFDETFIDSVCDMTIMDINYYTITRLDHDTIRTDCGTYQNCYKIQSSLKSIRGKAVLTWYYPNIGPVKIYYPNYNLTFELIDYVIN